MIDKIRNSFKDLEAPTCSKCGGLMSWFSSQLIEYSPLAIEHTFYCSACGTRKIRKDISPEKSVEPPSKLSRPKLGRVA